MIGRIRTTITLQDDVAAAVEQRRRERGIGMSEAVNELIRAGLRPKPHTTVFHQRTHALGLRIDVTNVADALDQLEESEDR
jgi:hypothetical protein